MANMLWRFLPHWWMNSSSSSAIESDQRKTTLQLSNLPPELILQIADHLPISSAACLALCDRRLSILVGSRIWPRLHHSSEVKAVSRSRRHEPETNEIERFSFLSILSRDLPKRYACNVCQRLHPNLQILEQRSINSRRFTPCWAHEDAICPRLHTSFILTFTHLQLLMKRHSYGPKHGIPLSIFSFTEVDDEIRDGEAKTSLLSVDANIIGGECFLRSQQWVMLPPQSDPLEVIPKLSHIFDLCRHNHVGYKLDGDQSGVLQTILSQLYNLHGRPVDYVPEIRSCKDCLMDFCIDTIELQGGMIAASITQWRNLGAGQEVYDPKWKCHIGRREPQHVTHETGSLREKYEDYADQTCEEFTEENISKLVSNRPSKLLGWGVEFPWRMGLPIGRDRKRWTLAIR